MLKYILLHINKILNYNTTLNNYKDYLNEIIVNFIHNLNTVCTLFFSVKHHTRHIKKQSLIC